MFEIFFRGNFFFRVNFFFREDFPSEEETKMQDTEEDRVASRKQRQVNDALGCFSKIQDVCHQGDLDIGRMADILFNEEDLTVDVEGERLRMLKLFVSEFQDHVAQQPRLASKMAPTRTRQDFKRKGRQVKRGKSSSISPSYDHVIDVIDDDDVFRCLVLLLSLALRMRSVHKSESYKVVTSILGSIDLREVPTQELEELVVGDSYLEVFVRLLISYYPGKKTDGWATSRYLVGYGDPYKATRGVEKAHLMTWQMLCSMDMATFEQVLLLEEVSGDIELKAWYEKLLKIVNCCLVHI